MARSIQEIRERLRDLDEALPRGDPEHASVGELREAIRRFANRHNPNLDWDDFSSKLGPSGSCSHPSRPPSAGVHSSRGPRRLAQRVIGWAARRVRPTLRRLCGT